MKHTFLLTKNAEGIEKNFSSIHWSPERNEAWTRLASKLQYGRNYDNVYELSVRINEYTTAACQFLISDMCIDIIDGDPHLMISLMAGYYQSRYNIRPVCPLIESWAGTEFQFVS